MPVLLPWGRIDWILTLNVFLTCESNLRCIQMHPRACIVCDDDATMELRVKTVKYFKGLMETHNRMLHRQSSGGDADDEV